MKLKLENAVRHSNLGSRSRTTKKMNSATTPEYESTEMNGIIIKNFINHLSTTKSNIESTIPNPNQFYTTPSPDGADIEPLVIMNSNAFFPVNEMNVNNYDSNGGVKYGEQDDGSSPPIIVSSSTNNNNIPHQHQYFILNQNQVVTQHPPNLSTYPQTSRIPVTSTAIPKPIPKISHNPTQTSVNHQKVRVPSRKGSQPTSRPLKTVIRRRPAVQSQHNKQQSVKVTTTMTSQHNTNQTIKVPMTNQPLANVPNGMNVQQNMPLNSSPLIPSSMQSILQNPQYEPIQSPVVLAPSKENSLNIYNAVSSQQMGDPMQHFNPAMTQYPTNQALNEQSLITGQPIGQFNKTLHQPQIPLPIMQDSPVNRPNNSLKQLQLQFLLDCNLLDPQTKTKIPLGTNPVGDDFFFTPMPYIQNQNAPVAPSVNIKQLPFNPFNPLNFLPSFPSLFPTTPPPITAVVLTDQTTQQPIYVSVQTTQNPNRRRHKKKVKNVYVDLPIVSEVGNMLDRVYNFMEESLVTKVVKKTETQPPRRAQASQTSQTPVPQIVVVPSNQLVPLSAIDGSSEEDYLQRYTTPYYRTTRSRRHRPKKRRRPISSTYYTNRLPSNNWQPISFHRQKRTTLVPNYVRNGSGKKNILTTKIHVTSEYNGPHPTETIDYQEDRRKVNATKVDKSSESSEEEKVKFFLLWKR